MSNQPKVSIIILNWNGLQDTLECLDSLKKISYPNYKIIVVDNGSTGDDVQVIRHRYDQMVEIIENRANLGFTGGNNVAIKAVLQQAESKYIMLLNNDTKVEPDFLSQLVTKIESDDQVGIVGPVIHYYDKPQKIHSQGGVISLYWGWHFVGGSYHRQPYKDATKFLRLHYYSGAAMLIRTEVLRQVGSFDNDYFYYTEDVDLGYRVFKAGYKIVCEPKSKIYHKEGSSVGQEIRNPKTAFYENRNAVMFIRKHGTWLQKIIFITYLFPKMFFDLFKFWPQEKKVIGQRFKGIIWHLNHRVKKYQSTL